MELIKDLLSILSYPITINTNSVSFRSLFPLAPFDDTPVLSFKKEGGQKIYIPVDEITSIYQKEPKEKFLKSIKNEFLTEHYMEKGLFLSTLDGILSGENEKLVFKINERLLKTGNTGTLIEFWKKIISRFWEEIKFNEKVNNKSLIEYEKDMSGDEFTKYYEERKKIIQNELKKGFNSEINFSDESLSNDLNVDFLTFYFSLLLLASIPNNILKSELEKGGESEYFPEVINNLIKVSKKAFKRELGGEWLKFKNFNVKIPKLTLYLSKDQTVSGVPIAQISNINELSKPDLKNTSSLSVFAHREEGTIITINKNIKTLVVSDLKKE